MKWKIMLLISKLYVLLACCYNPYFSYQSEEPDKSIHSQAELIIRESDSDDEYCQTTITQQSLDELTNSGSLNENYEDPFDIQAYEDSCKNQPLDNETEQIFTESQNILTNTTTNKDTKDTKYTKYIKYIKDPV